MKAEVLGNKGLPFFHALRLGEGLAPDNSGEIGENPVSAQLHTPSWPMGSEDMVNETPSDLESVFERVGKELEGKRQVHQQVIDSAEYQAQLTRLGRISLDFLKTLRLCWFATTRAGDWNDKSLFMRSIEDLGASAVMVRAAVQEGLRNSARRELRYMIEIAVKALYVDQQMSTSDLKTKLVYFEKKVDADVIKPARQLEFALLPADQSESVVKRLKDAYIKACQYVHPTVHQIEERLKLAEMGVGVGFETAEHLRESNDELFEVFSLVIVLLFESVGYSFAGDIWETGGLSACDEWSFHCHDLIASIDECFDSKAERQDRLEAIKQRRSDRLAQVDTPD